MFVKNEIYQIVGSIGLEIVNWLVKGFLFHPSALKLESKFWQGISDIQEDTIAIQGDTIALQDDEISYLKDDRLDHTENEIYWLGETRSLYNQLPNTTRGFVDEYSDRWNTDYLEDPENFYFG